MTWQKQYQTFSIIYYEVVGMYRYIYANSDEAKVKDMADKYNTCCDLVFKAEDKYIFYFDNKSIIKKEEFVRKNVTERYVLQNSLIEPNRYYSFDGSFFVYKNPREISTVICDECKLMDVDYKKGEIKILDKKVHYPIMPTIADVIYFSSEVMKVLEDNMINFDIKEKLFDKKLNYAILKFNKTEKELIIEGNPKIFQCTKCGTKQIYIGSKHQIYYDNYLGLKDIFSSKENTGGKFYKDEGLSNFSYYIFSSKAAYIIEYFLTFLPKVDQSFFYWQEIGSRN
jgi:hypothetical protein